MILPTRSPEPTTSRRYSALLLPPLARNGKLARLMVAYQRATPRDRPALEAEYDRLFPPGREVRAQAVIATISE